MGESPFEKALEKRQKEKEKNDKKGGDNNFQYQELQWMFLKADKESVFRVIGEPWPTRKKSTDTKLILYSEILKDDKSGYFRCNWKPAVDEDGYETENLDPDWFLTRFYNDVMRNKWQNYPEGEKDGQGNTGKRVFFNEGTETYNRIKFNKKEGRLYPPRVYPSKVFITNVIDRHDLWCETNSHTKLLSRREMSWEVDKRNESGKIVKERNSVAVIGVPYAVYEKLIDDVVSYSNHWDLDVVVKRNGKEYSARDITEKKISDESKIIGNADPLTAKEKEYEKYNLDKLFGVTSYSKIKKNIGGLIKLWDSESGSNYTEELNALVAEEEKKWGEAASKVEKESMKELESESVLESSEVEVTKEKDSEFIEEVERRESKIEVNNENKEFSINKEHFPNYDKLSEKDKTIFMDSIKSIENGIPQWKSDIKVLGCSNMECEYPGTNMTTAFPTIMKTCPVCGEQC